MTTEDHNKEDITQMEYINRWKEKREFRKENRKYYFKTMMHYLKLARFSFGRYLKGWFRR